MRPIRGAATLSLPLRSIPQKSCPYLHHRPQPAAPAQALAPSTTLHRSFHTTTPRPKHHRKSKHRNISYVDMQKINDRNTKMYKAYTEEELADLRKRYTPKQMAAIEAAEAAITASDLATQGKVRRDPLQFQYLDDFSRIEPTIDFKLSKIRGEGQDYENVTDFAEAPNVVRMMGEIEEAAEESEAQGNWETDPEIEIDDETGLAPEFEAGFVPELGTYSATGIDDGTGMAETNMEETDMDETDMEETDMHESDLADHQPGPAYDFDQDVDIAVARRLLDDPEYAQALADPENEDKEEVAAYYSDKHRRELLHEPLPPYNRFEDPLEDRINKILDVAIDSPDVAPDIPKIQDPSVRWGPTEEETEGDSNPEENEAARAYARVAKAMGQSVDQLKKYRVKTLVHRQVVNQTRLGKISSAYYLCVAGNGNGLVGIGEGKAAEPDEAQRVAQLNAIRSMVPILRYEGRTIYGEVKGKSGAVEVKLSARQPGYGVRCSEKIFEIARCAGLADLQAKVVRKARNPMNVAKAVWQALRSQRDPEEVAMGRGKKLVDVRKVYYSGLV